MNLILLYTGSIGFPLGDAYTNRVLSIAKGLIAVGCDITLLIIYPGRSSGVNHKKGVFETVPYEYLTPLKTSKNPLIKKLIGFWGIFNTIYAVLFRYNTDAIISFTESSLYNSTISFFVHLRNIPFIRETNEYPRGVLKKGINGLSVSDVKKIKNSLKCLDGLICISNSLSDYFKTNYQFARPILIVPIVVDKERFSFTTLETKEKYITYCGNLFGEKDGVEFLVRAFAKISPSHPDYKLKLIGGTGDTIEYEKLQRLISSLGATGKVVLTGYIERGEIPFHLINSEVLTLARPNNIQAQGGFPTKLGEYLATSKPVVVTTVGDIPNYLTDGVNAYLAPPGSVEGFAEKLDYVLCNYTEALEVGKQGRILVEKVFDPSVQALRISEFVLNFKKEIH